MAAEQVDYQPGETIFITASSGNMYETEVLIVASLAADNVTITVTTPLQHDHKSFIYTVAGQVVDMRVEVALLSRNVRIQGDDKQRRAAVRRPHDDDARRHHAH